MGFLPIIFGGGVLALIVAVLTGKKASAKTVTPGGGGTVPSLPPSPSPGTTLPPEVKAAAEAVKNGTATPKVVADAIEAAHEAGQIGAAERLAEEMDKLMRETIPAIVQAPDRPGGVFHGTGPKATGSGVPLYTDGKTLWYPEVKGGARMMLPRYGAVLVQFRSLQQALGVNPDGRLGPGTLKAFIEATQDQPKAPRTLEALAANAVKWTEIIKGKIAPGYVAGPFE